MKPILLQHYLEESAAQFPETVAIQNGKETITYAALLAAAKALGVALKDRSPARGERVGIFLDKSIEQVVAILGTLYADKVFVLMNAALHAKQVGFILRDCGVGTLITTRELQSTVLQKTPEAAAVARVIFQDELPTLIASGAGREPDCRNITDDISNIVYTSGSTGSPKGVVITHRNLLDTARNSTAHIQVASDERILCPVALNFDYGLNQLTSTLFKGCTLVLYKYTLPNELLRTIVDERITGLAALPPIWASVFNARLARFSKDDYDFSRLRYVLNTGAKLAVPLVRKVRETFPGARLYLMYGFTEAFRSTFLDHTEVDRIPESIGKALPNVQIEVINERNEICKPGEIGELIHRGAGVTRGYWNSPELTAKLLRPNPLMAQNEWFMDTFAYSGDLVKRDEDGFIYYVGRKDHQIKTSGYRVSPTEVEALIMECPGVAEVVVFGLDDVALGQKIRALVALSGNITAKEILDHCRAEAPYYMVPRELFVVANFPRTANGKIDRPRAIVDSRAEHGL